jgi:hypothetical protein
MLAGRTPSKLTAITRQGVPHLPGATIFVSAELVSNLEPLLVARGPVTVLSVSAGFVGSRACSGRHKQNSRNSKYDLPAHD